MAGGSERDRILWSKEGEKEGRRRTTRDIVRQLEVEIRNRKQDHR